MSAAAARDRIMVRRVSMRALRLVSRHVVQQGTARQVTFPVRVQTACLDSAMLSAIQTCGGVIAMPPYFCHAEQPMMWTVTRPRALRARATPVEPFNLKTAVELVQNR
jgi:hypothetical protein